MSTSNMVANERCIRDRLLDAAETLAAQSGVQGMTLDAIAHLAGISKGGLLFHFPHKRMFIRATVSRLVRHCEDIQINAMDNDPCSAGRFTRAYLAARTQSCGPECQSSYIPLLMASGKGQQDLEEFRDQVATWPHRLEDDGINAVSALIVRLAADGMTLNRMLGLPFPGEELCRKTIKALLSMTLHVSSGLTSGRELSRTTRPTAISYLRRAALNRTNFTSRATIAVVHSPIYLCQ